MLEIPKGEYRRYMIRNQPIHLFMSVFDCVLLENRFLTKRCTSDGHFVYHQAVFGDKVNVYFWNLIPGGFYTERGSRYGAEAVIYPFGPDVILYLSILPYYNLADEQYGLPRFGFGMIRND